METVKYVLLPGHRAHVEPNIGEIYEILFEIEEEKGITIATMNGDPQTRRGMGHIKGRNGVFGHMSNFPSYSVARYYSSINEEKCECGSGNNTRCQNHSPWCKLYVRVF